MYRTYWSYRNRQAFTIVELLVVIAIVGIMVGLLLPAVQSAREAARFTQCRNRLRQIALGVHNHESQYKCLPDGGLNWFADRSKRGGTPLVSPEQDWGWMYQILPFIEEGAIYDEPNDVLVQGQSIATYYCPSRRSATVKEHLGIWRAMNDYAGNGGVLTQMTAYWGDGKNGSFFGRREFTPRATMATIRDGLSNTLMAGEKSVNHLFYQSLSCADNEGWTAGWDWDTIRWGNIAPIHDNRANDCMPWFGAVHQGGCLFAFGDASIHTISYSIDEVLMQSLAHAQDSRPLSFND